MKCEYLKGAKENEVCRVVVTNDKGEFVIDTLVKPRTQVVSMERDEEFGHGIKESQLERAPTFEKVQMAIKKLLKSSPGKGPVIIGVHPHKDLRTFQMLDYPFVDLSTLFLSKNHDFETLSRKVLRCRMPLRN